MSCYMVWERKCGQPQALVGRWKLTFLCCSIGSFYAFIMARAKPVRLSVVARSNYDAVKKNVRAIQPSYNMESADPLKSRVLQ